MADFTAFGTTKIRFGNNLAIDPYQGATNFKKLTENYFTLITYFVFV